MNHDAYDDSYIRGILKTVKSIAMVGISPKENRPSYFAFKYLLERGYRMIPVNPGQAGKEILGQTVYAKLADIPEPVDMVLKQLRVVEPIREGRAYRHLHIVRQIDGQWGRLLHRELNPEELVVFRALLFDLVIDRFKDDEMADVIKQAVGRE